MDKRFLVAGMILMFGACKQTDTSSKAKIEMKYPDTRQDSSVHDIYFGTRVADPYRWLEADTSAATAEWVKAQNDVTSKYLSQIPFIDSIRKRYADLFNYEKYSSPFKEGKFVYYFKNSGLQNQDVLYREDTSGSAPEVFLDPNTFSKDGTTSLRQLKFTKDGTLAAYQISEGGSDWSRIIVIDALTKKQVGDTMDDIKFSGIAWKNNEGFFYSSYDKLSNANVLSAKNEDHKLYFHKLGTSQKDDRLEIGGSSHPRRYINADVTENQKWLVIYATNSTYGNELYVKDLTKSGSPIIPLVANADNQQSILDADDQFFYIQTDKDAPTGKIVTAPVSHPESANWKTLIENKPEVLSASTGGGYLFCVYLKDAVSKVYQYEMNGNQVREIELPGLGSAYGFNAKHKEKELYFTYTSYIYPFTIFELDIASGKRTLYKKPDIKFNPEEYESKQVFYPSKDGTKIPMLITYKKGIELNGKNPLLLYGYGGFSVSLTPYFSTENIILFENGGVYAAPNLRGGGEYGEHWHQQGIKMKKQNVFDDFIAAAKYLIENKYTSKEFLAIEGGSNGGLLIGAVITQQPDLCKVAFPAVGVMDMLRYHKFTAGAGWAYDYGTSEDSKEMFEYLLHYSPLHNLKESTNYPATYITTADHDDRVVPAHSFKFAATMQAKNKGDNPVLIRIQTKAGHGAGKSTQQIIEETTEKWSFMFYNMGVNPKKIQ